MQNKTLSLISTASFILMVIVNILANTLPLGIGTTAMISDKYENMFTPAGYTFSIWGVIYIFMAIYILYQWGVFGGKHVRHDVKASTIDFSLTCILNICWLLAWHYDIMWLSTLIIVLLLVMLFRIANRFNRNETNETMRKIVSIGFEIYAGWIVAATIANISAFLVSISWSRFGLSDLFWLYIVMFVGVLISGSLTLIGKKQFASLAIIWAYVGILVKILNRTAVSPQLIIITSMYIVFMAVIVIYGFVKDSQTKANIKFNNI